MNLAKTTKSTAPTETTEGFARWGGAILAVGAVLSMVSLAAYLSLPTLQGTDGAARAAQLVAGAETARIVAYTGMFGSALLAAGAFLLAGRPVPNARGISSGVWVIVGVGALVSTGVNAFFGTGYLALAQTYAANPGIFQAALLTSSALAGLGLIGTSVGTALAFAGEASADRRTIPAAVSWVAVVGALGGLVAGAAFVTGLSALLPAAFGVFLLDVVLVYYGIRVSWPDVFAPTGAAAGARA